MTYDINTIIKWFPEDVETIHYLSTIEDKTITEMELHFLSNVRSIKVLSKILQCMKQSGWPVVRLFKVTNNDGEYFFTESLQSLSEQEQDCVTEIATAWRFM